MKKITLILLYLLGVAGMAHAQSSPSNSAKENPWTLLKEENGVKIYYQLDPGCAQKNSMFLRFENTTTESRTVSWIAPDFVIVPVLGYDKNQSMTLAPGTTISGECSSTAPLNLFWRFNKEGALPGPASFTVTK